MKSYLPNGLKVIYAVLWPLLYLLSFLYAFVVEVRKTGYRKGIFRSYRPSARVISVGNITLGGTGKTPLVEYLATQLVARGHRVAVLLRGYRRPKRKAGPAICDYDAYGDEASMLKRRLGAKARVAVGLHRAALAREMEKDTALDAFLLDDGFQHLALARDLDIVAVDATDPFGNRCLLPAGPLREGLSSLARADIFCVTRCDEVAGAALRDLEVVLHAVNPSALVVKSVHAPVFLYELKTGVKARPDFLKGRRVGALCGIANPLSFVRAIEKSGGCVAFRRFFEDHHDFTEEEVRSFARRCIGLNASAIVTTEKDAQRLRRPMSRAELGTDIFVLRIVLKVIAAEESLDERLRSLYRS